MTLPSAALSQTDKSIILGGGCFWCIEAIFKRIHGVTHVESGYCGGKSNTTTYEEVSSGTTGHAEVIKINYIPNEVTLETLLTVFFHLHDPTQKNRQGADIGTQYRSVIFYSSTQDKTTAQSVINKINASGLWKSPIVTTLEEELHYSKAEDYHQNYYDNQPKVPYCSFVIAPKIKKLHEDFPHLLQRKK